MKKLSAFFAGLQDVRTAMLLAVLAMSDWIICSSVYGFQDTAKCNEVQTEERYDPNGHFDKIWNFVNDDFWDPNFNGVDWEEARKRYKSKALAAKDHESFAIVVNQMLSELKTSHTRYFTKWEPDYYTLQAALISQRLAAYGTSDTSVLEKSRPGLYSSKAKPHRTGIGVVTKEIDGHFYVNKVLASSPAEKAGIVLGDLLLEVNGQKFHPVRSFQTKADQELELVLHRGPSVSARYLLKITPVDKEEKDLFENDAYARTKVIEFKGHRFAYMPLCWLGGWKMRSVLAKGFGLACDSEGFIVDIRDGFGGGPPVEYIDPFLRNGLETMISRQIERNRSLTSKVAFNRPVIVLINGGSRSGKELLAYYFKKTGRGILLGERTAGYVSAGRWKRISEDSILYYCAGMITVDGKRLEGVGVEPDIKVPFDVRLARGRDIQLERAKDEMVKLIEASS
ncbi:MAG TPA: S41 family peptidase [Sedimentisphaerales bacterium]|nr:S41 family peptidase [Sedimentisphaerales bacterium]